MRRARQRWRRCSRGDAEKSKLLPARGRAAALFVFTCLLGVGLLAGPVHAMPALDVAHVDPDPAAEALAWVDPEDDEQGRALEAQLRREPRNAQLRLLQARLLADRGLRQRVTRELSLAERFADPGSVMARAVQYNAGWIQFRLGDFEAARMHWEAARLQHGGAPAWVPITYALLLWSQGDRAAALGFYARAAADRPELFGADADADALTAAQSGLRPGDRFALDSMREAWLRGDN